jgi:hypothetical protein
MKPKNYQFSLDFMIPHAYKGHHLEGLRYK